jgi:hypothetical protein
MLLQRFGHERCVDAVFEGNLLHREAGRHDVVRHRQRIGVAKVEFMLGGRYLVTVDRTYSFLRSTLLSAIGVRHRIAPQGYRNSREGDVTERSHTGYCGETEPTLPFAQVAAPEVPVEVERPPKG